MEDFAQQKHPLRALDFKSFHCWTTTSSPRTFFPSSSGWPFTRALLTPPLVAVADRNSIPGEREGGPASRPAKPALAPEALNLRAIAKGS